MKIALVLSRTPGYSETFFRSKIAGLLKKGFVVELFVDHKDPSFNLCPQFALPGNSPVRFIFTFLKVLFTHPQRLFSLYSKLSKDGKNLRERIIAIYSNLHLLQS